MAERQRGMGRGLAAILATSRDETDDLRRIPIELISPNPRQPRRVFEDEALQALADSIRSRGVLQPVLVRPLPDHRFELVAGERRWRAARLADLVELPAIIRRHEDAAVLEAALIENMVREDLNPVEEARACAALVEELGLTREEVGVRVGRSRVAISNLIRLLDLPDDALALIEQRLLTEGHGRALLTSDDHGIRRTLARTAAVEGWSVRELEAAARRGPEAGRPPAANRDQGLHPDQRAAADQIRDAFEPAFGPGVTIRPTRGGGYRATVAFASVEEALEAAQRLRGTTIAAAE